MTSNGPPNPCAHEGRKKHKKSDGKHRNCANGGSWGLSVPHCDDGIEHGGHIMEPFCDSQTIIQSGGELCENEELLCNDNNEMNGTSCSDSSPPSSGPMLKCGTSGPQCPSDVSGSSVMGNLKDSIDQFMHQKRAIMQQIKSCDPELFSEYCKCDVGKSKDPWYNPPATGKHCQRPNSHPSQMPKPAVSRHNGCSPHKQSNSPSKHNACPPKTATSHHARHSETKCKPVFAPKSTPQHQSDCPPHKQMHPKSKINYTPNMPAYQEPPHISTPSESPPESKTHCAKQKPKSSPHQICAPKITGDQKKDIEAKQTFAKIKKIELESVLDRNVHDLSLDAPDRDPELIADLMNSHHVQLDNDPTEVYSALVHPIGHNKLSATDIHHTDPGSMVPKKIPVYYLNHLSAEVLDELEAIFKSQLIAYPQDDLATHETRGLDVTETEAEQPKPPPPPPLLKCTLELQPLRVENFFQLRGSNSPTWYPGMLATFPDGDSSLRLIQSPSGLIKTAYTFCKP